MLAAAISLPVLLAPVVGGQSPGPYATTRSLEQRLDAVSAEPHAELVRGVLEQAERALAVARQPAQEPEAIQSARAIAEAALVLAERQLARRSSHEALSRAERRLRDVRSRAQAQRRVLEALMQERAALARAEESP